MIQILIKNQFPKESHMAKKSSLKYFIGYDDNDEITPLCMKLPQISSGMLKEIRQCLLNC